MQTIPNKLSKIQTRITEACQQYDRAAGTVSLLAVSKTKPASAIDEAYQCGQRDFGENYLQEALDKQQQLQQLAICWHFIGPIQSNKTRAIAENFNWVHSVDRLKIAQRLSAQRPSTLPPLNICLQVKLDDEDSKSGVSLAELPAIAETVNSLEHLQLRGLMAIPQARSDFEQQKSSLLRLKQALTSLQQDPRFSQLDTLSMGMSADLEAAIAAGSTWVRIGSDIFGQRPPQKDPS